MECYNTIRKKSEYLISLEKYKGNLFKTWRKTGVSNSTLTEWLKNDDCFSTAFRQVLDELENNVEE